MLSSSFYYSDLTEKLSCPTDQQHQIHSTKNVIIGKKTANFKPVGPTGPSSKAVKECINGGPNVHSEPWVPRYGLSEEECWEPGTSVEALLLLHKSILERQLELSVERIGMTDMPSPQESSRSKKDVCVTSSGIPARVRRINAKKKSKGKNSTKQSSDERHSGVILQNHVVGYVRGLTSYELLTHQQVVNLSNNIRAGLSLEHHRSRLKEKLGCEASDEQLAQFLRMNRTELRSKLIECTLATEKLAMSNVRLVMSVAQKYDNMGADMADLVQGGLIGLLRGIQKFDSSRGFKISTYVYWWIRQGVSRALMENSRTLRLPTHLHERLSLIRGAKNRLEEKGINPSIDRIAETLNMSHKKIKNATEAVRPVFSLDRQPFPSLNGLPGMTYHSYIADNRLENNPWHGVDEWTLKYEVSHLIDTALREREREIIRLYYGLDDEPLTWEEISKRIGLSRERVRQVGLIAFEKLKHAARKTKMDALLVKH
ncbi:RNA polymerase sigma factor sigA-like [Silene latifolia]|uniref:RNA polymerase sigma factor sigA-like n=1 Tax=Silene latifolia TaxID=37657 RepID=UPI003D77F672